MAAPIKQRPVLKEGFLSKRQRGQHKGQNLKGLRFQNRFVRLDSNFLFYSVSIGDKPKGKFSVNSIAVVEEVPSETFPGLNFCFQIGNQDEVMYFGAKDKKERKEWMEAIRVATLLNNNEMYSHYHPGAFGKDVPNQWSCCRKVEKDANGCCESSSIDGAYYTFKRTQSAIYDNRVDTSSPENDKEHTKSCSIPSSPSSELFESLNDTPAYVKFEGNKSLPVYKWLLSQGSQPDQAYSLHDQIDAESVHSADSGYTGKYSSMSSLFSAGNQGSSSLHRSQRAPFFPKDSIEELDHEELPELAIASSETLDHKKVYCSKYHSSLTALDFKEADTLYTGCEDGKVFMLDIIKSTGEDTGIQYGSFTSKVTSIMTWKSILAVSTENGVELRNIANKEIKHSLPSHLLENHFGVSPDGSKIFTANLSRNVLEVWQIDSMEMSVLAPSRVMSLPGKAMLLSVSPDPKRPLVAIVVVDNSTMVLHLIDYHTMQICGDKRTIGDYNLSYPIVGLFSPHEPKMTVGHHDKLVFVDVEHDQLHEHMISNEGESVNITCLKYSPVGKELAVGRSDGVVSLLDGRINDLQIHQTLNYAKKKDAAVLSLSFSKDCSLLAIGHSDGYLNVIRTQLMDIHPHPSLQSLNTKNISSSGDILQLPQDDITVVFPEGFIDKPSLNFKYAVQTHEYFGPCSFPPGVRPVSAILSLHPEEDVKFLKPIEISMPHFINLETEEDCRRLTYFKACFNDYKMVKGKRLLNFKAVSPETETALFTYRHLHKTRTSKTIFENRLQFARLYADHCCCYCVGEHLVEDTNKAMFCLVQAQDMSVSTSKTHALHYCLPYCLKTCIRNVKNQFPEKSYQLTTHVVKFSSDKDDDDPSMGIEILHQDQLSQNGWKWNIQNGNVSDKIYRKDVCFWDIPTIQQLNEMCQQKKFPPRFILEITSPSHSIDSELEIIFPGIVQAFRRAEPKFVVQLKGFPLYGSRAISRVTSGQSHGSEGTEPKIDEPEAQAVKKYITLISKSVSDPCTFIMELYSNELLNDKQAEENISSSGAGEIATDNEKVVLNFKVLIKVRDSILRNPGKFDSLCKVLDDLKIDDCSKKLTDEVEKLRKPSISGSEYGEECDSFSPLLLDSNFYINTPTLALPEAIRPFNSPNLNQSIMSITDV